MHLHSIYFIGIMYKYYCLYIYIYIGRYKVQIVDFLCLSNNKKLYMKTIKYLLLNGQVRNTLILIYSFYNILSFHRNVQKLR